jgi:hypothetical protein
MPPFEAKIAEPMTETRSLGERRRNSFSKFALIDSSSDLP